jgi:porin
MNAYATWQSFIPDASAVSVLAYYQTFLDRRLEVKFGILPNQGEFVGQSIGGAFATTQGPAGSIISQLGMPALPVSTPSFRVTAHLTDAIYNQTAVMGSLVVNGPSGNVFFDTHALNPSNLRWNVNTSSYSPTEEIGAPGTRQLFVDEIGYKREAAPGSLYSWVRLGAMYNNSTFHDYAKSVAAGGLVRGPIGPTVDGDTGFYFLADQQICQFAPDSPRTASRGIYVGGTAMYAQPQTTAVTQYYDARLYVRGWVGRDAAV